LLTRMRGAMVAAFKSVRRSPGFRPGRKVRAPKGRMPGNAR
jgi:hypothetical protein